MMLLRFSIRNMLIGIGCLCAIIACITGSARRQKEAVRLLRKTQHSVYYDSSTCYHGIFFPEFGSGQCQPMARTRRASAYGMIRNRLDTDLVDTVTGVELGPYDQVLTDYGHETPVSPRYIVSPEEIDAVASLSRLRWLSFDGTDVGRDHLQRIWCLSDLHYLSLRNTHLSSGALSQLTHLVALEELSVDNSNIGDEDIRAISELRQLRRLTLSKTAVTDKGVRWIGRLLRLEVLDLSETLVSDEGARSLVDLPMLQELRLNRTGVSDHAIEFLRTKPGLRHIYAFQTNPATQEDN